MVKKVAACIVSGILTLNLLASTEKVDGIAAIVGDEIILQSEVDAFSLLKLNEMKVSPQSVDMTKFRQKSLQELIDSKVLLVHAKEDSTISAGAEEVESALENHVAMILRQNNMTQQQLEQELVKQNMTFAKFKADARKAIKENLLRQKVQQSYFATTKVSRRDVEEFFNQYKDSLPLVGESVNLSKLSVRLTATDSLRQAAYQKIHSIHQELLKGAAFEELAKKHSESPEGKTGGDLGFIAKGTLSEIAFEEKVFSLGNGQISEPFETKLGYHVIQVTEKRGGKVNVRQIFIRVAPTEAQVSTLHQKLDSIRTAVKTENEFVDAVKKLSHDNASKSRDGVLGWYALEELPQQIRASIDSLSEGGISAPVQDDQSMLSIYRINKKVDKRARSLENDWAILSEKAKEIYAQKKLINDVEKWRKTIFIDVRM